MSWDVTTPAGSEAASSGDDRIREFKTDIQTALQVEGAFPVNPASPEFHPRGGKGALASRPTAANGGLWFDTDNAVMTRSTGAAWEQVGSMATANQISSENTNQTIASASATDITNATVTITTLGRPVLLFLTNINATTYGYVWLRNTASASSIVGQVNFVRGATIVSGFGMTATVAAAVNASFLERMYPASCFLSLDAVAAGTYTYKATAQVSNAGTTQILTQALKLVAIEL